MAWAFMNWDILKPYITKALILSSVLRSQRCPLWLLRLSVKHLVNALCLLRKRLAEKNIKDSFPSISRRWVAQLTYRSFKRTIEQRPCFGTHLNPKRIVKLSINEKNKRLLSENQNPELGYFGWFLISAMPKQFLDPYYIPQSWGVCFVPSIKRTWPIRQAIARKIWREDNRSRMVVCLALRVLKDKVLAMLFDQNAGIGTHEISRGRFHTPSPIFYKKYRPRFFSFTLQGLVFGEVR